MKQSRCDVWQSTLRHACSVVQEQHQEMYCLSLIQEQVTPTSVTGTFAERSPFQSTRPTELASQSLESQQSLGGSSFQGTLTDRHFVLPIPETCQS